MERLIVKGGKRLLGNITVSGAKNVALKALVAACLTNEDVIVENIPLISDFFVMVDIIKELGGKVLIKDHSAKIRISSIKKTEISLEKAAEIRTSSIFLAPLLARTGKATIPNPGGCRIGARPIDRTIEGLRKMGANIAYDSSDGYFHASVKEVKGTEYEFDKNTHTGTETMILASVLANGQTVLKNAAEEPEIDELIVLLKNMGAKIKRIHPRTIVIDGVKKLSGTRFVVGPDRNEAVTLAIAAIITKGDVVVEGITKEALREFLEKLNASGAGFEEKENGLRFFYKGPLKATNITTSSYPGFMTDWQSPWAVLMTKAMGESTIHETVFESRFGYGEELKKMGARIEFFNPQVSHPEKIYNFNLDDDNKRNFHAIKVFGPTNLHNGVVNISDLRSGATLLLAALSASGESVIFGVEKLDRGYEQLDQRLNILGAAIKRVKE